jgi:tetratricopeptide (TPR) repeat protein
MPRRPPIFVVLVSLAALSACRGAPPSSAARPPETVTFNRDVAPILFEHCASCHRPGDTSAGATPSAAAGAASGEPWCIAGAPFPLIEYRDVRAHAAQVAAAVATRRMPPWLPEDDSARFSHERRLRPDQIELIQRWVAQGAREGETQDRPVVPRWPEGWQLGQPDLVVEMPEAYTLPATGSDVFRNFVLPVPVTTTRYVKAVEFRAGNPRVLHHASIGVDRTRASRRLDRADAGPGFAVMPEGEVRNVYGWSPGKAPAVDADAAWTLEPGSDLVAQLHMLPSGKPEAVRPAIGLFFTDTPPARPPLVLTLQSKTIEIPAGEASYVAEDRYVLPADADALSVYPHAHYLATEMKGVATRPDGSTAWLIWIKHWDFNWQDTYRFASPLFLPKGTTLTMTYTYDNSDRNPKNPSHPPRAVQWGPQSSDEMAALWIEVRPRRAEDARLLARDSALRAMQADVANAEMQVRHGPADAAARNFLAAKYLQGGRVPDAMTELDAALRLAPDDAEAHSNRGVALQLLGRAGDAVQELHTAARLKPGDDRVRFNLGNALHAVGNIDEAAREYERAIALNPENADAHFNLALILGPRRRLDEAVVHLRRALAVNPQNGDVHRNLGIALGMQGRRDQAIAELEEALRINPESAEARQNLTALTQR